MAIVTKFQPVVKESRRGLKDTECGYGDVELDGIRYFVLESYGSGERQKVGKTSQLLHLDRHHAAELKTLLQTAFPGI